MEKSFLEVMLNIVNYPKYIYLKGFENDQEMRLDNPLLNFNLFHVTISLMQSIFKK